eukprot:Rhum_TRINITY_DN12095_c0_g1::Rhum_TRINITY_DN12095_c0_g1_i1::g.48478::m.48478
MHFVFSSAHSLQLGGDVLVAGRLLVAVESPRVGQVDSTLRQVRRHVLADQLPGVAHVRHRLAVDDLRRLHQLRQHHVDVRAHLPAPVVRDQRVRDHVVPRPEQRRHRLLHVVLDLLPQQELGLPHLRRHLARVLDGHVGDRVPGVRAEALVELQRLRPRGAVGGRDREAVHHVAEVRHVLERGVHALSEEGHHRVRRVAEKRHLVLEHPVRHARRREEACRVAGPLGLQVGDERDGVRVRLLHVLHALRHGQQLLHRHAGRRGLRRVVRQVEGTRHGAVEVGEAHQEVGAAGPDVQVAGVQRLGAVLLQREHQLLVRDSQALHLHLDGEAAAPLVVLLHACVEVLDRRVDQVLHQLAARARGGTVGAEAHVAPDGDQLVRLHAAEGPAAGGDVGGLQAVVEDDLHALLLRGVEQMHVEPGAGDAVVRLVLVLAVGLHGGRAVLVVNAAADGRHHELHDRVLEAEAAQREAAAGREDEVDAAVHADLLLAEVLAALVDDDVEAATLQGNGEEGARQAGTHDEDAVGVGRHYGSFLCCCCCCSASMKYRYCSFY